MVLACGTHAETSRALVASRPYDLPSRIIDKYELLLPVLTYLVQQQRAAEFHVQYQLASTREDQSYR